MPTGVYVRTEEHKKILRSNAKNGKGTPKKTRIDIEEFRLAKAKRWMGELNPNWNNGVSKERRCKHNVDVPYKKWRMSVFERDNWTCQGCGVRGVYIVAHHIKSWALFKDLRFDVNNGVTLCEPCHSLTDNYKGRGKKIK